LYVTCIRGGAARISADLGETTLALVLDHALAIGRALTPGLGQASAPLVSPAQVVKESTNPGGPLNPRLWLSVELSPVGCGGAGARAVPL